MIQLLWNMRINLEIYVYVIFKFKLCFFFWWLILWDFQPQNHCKAKRTHDAKIKMHIPIYSRFRLYIMSVTWIQIELPSFTCFVYYL